jgi:hypothetical protein
LNFACPIKLSGLVYVWTKNECGKRGTKVALHDYMPLCDKAFSGKGPVLHTLVGRIISLKVINLKGYKTA